MSHLIARIEGVDIWEEPDGRVWWVSKCAIDCDGPNGNPDNDPNWQSETTLKHEGKSIDSYVVSGIVVPPAIINGVKGIVMGCYGRITYLRKDGLPEEAVVYDRGPSYKIGEASVRAAQATGIPSNPNSGGADPGTVLFEIFPGEAALVDGVQYTLQLA